MLLLFLVKETSANNESGVRQGVGERSEDVLQTQSAAWTKCDVSLRFKLNEINRHACGELFLFQCHIRRIPVSGGEETQ